MAPQRVKAQGKSYQSIADRLNRDKVPTAHGGAKWYAATVRHVVLRCDEGSGPSIPDTTRMVVVAGAA
jgi:hypothetical protein